MRRKVTLSQERTIGSEWWDRVANDWNTGRRGAKTSSASSGRGEEQKVKTSGSWSGRVSGERVLVLRSQLAVPLQTRLTMLF